jgi:hypothetical protein
VTLEQLIFDSESKLLEEVYYRGHYDPASNLQREEMQDVLEMYMVHWMIGRADAAGVEALMRNRSLLNTDFPQWPEIKNYAHGRIRSFDFQKQRASRPSLKLGYNMDDAHEVVGGITRSFASFWESECVGMKSALVSLDAKNTGRVPMSSFYKMGLYTDTRFSESEVYLREMGMLDESSTWQGPQVLVANYLQGISNCIISSQHYSVCCLNECEAIIGEIETELGAHAVLPEEVLRVLQNVSSRSNKDQDEPPIFTTSLKSQLAKIAEVHNGKVPLHGRLLAQWLHNLYPLECPYPHKAGSYEAKHPHDYDGEYLASRQDMKRHITIARIEKDPSEDVVRNEEQWLMEQFVEDEEELISTVSLKKERSSFYMICVGMVVLLVVALGFFVTARSEGPSISKPSVPSRFGGHSHLV